MTRLRSKKIEDRIVGDTISQAVNYRIINDWNRGDIDLCRLLLVMFPEISQSFGDRMILILYFDIVCTFNKIARFRFSFTFFFFILI